MKLKDFKTRKRCTYQYKLANTATLQMCNFFHKSSKYLFIFKDLWFSSTNFFISGPRSCWGIWFDQANRSGNFWENQPTHNCCWRITFSYDILLFMVSFQESNCFLINSDSPMPKLSWLRKIFSGISSRGLFWFSKLIVWFKEMCLNF